GIHLAGWNPLPWFEPPRWIPTRHIARFRGSAAAVPQVLPRERGGRAAVLVRGPCARAQAGQPACFTTATPPAGTVTVPAAVVPVSSSVPSASTSAAASV